MKLLKIRPTLLVLVKTKLQDGYLAGKELVILRHVEILSMFGVIISIMGGVWIGILNIFVSVSGHSFLSLNLKTICFQNTYAISMYCSVQYEVQLGIVLISLLNFE